MRISIRTDAQKFAPLLAIRAADCIIIDDHHFNRTCWTSGRNKMGVAFAEIALGSYLVTHFAITEKAAALTTKVVTAHK